MRFFLGIFLFFFVLESHGQTQKKLHFDYDSSGNQVKRYIMLYDFSAGRVAKNIEQVKATDLQEVPEIEQLTYYPNPVREQLYFIWKNTTESVIVSMQLMNSSGQILREFSGLNQKNDLIVDFNAMPSGMYVIGVGYSNGSQKSVKVVKQ